MNKTLQDTELSEILPLSLKEDEKFNKLSDVLTAELKELNQFSEYASLYENIDALPESILRLMAVDAGVYGPEWFVAETLEKRRQLVKDGFILAKRRGTRWAVERVFEIIGWTVELKEWFEEGADPYTFRVSLLDITNIGMSEEKAKWLLALIDLYKPVSRHLTSINLVTNVEPLQYGAKIGVYFRAEIEG